MRYKLIDYCNNKLYLYGKKDLFKYFDLVILSSNRKGNINNVIYEYKLNSYFSDHFEFNEKGKYYYKTIQRMECRYSYNNHRYLCEKNDVKIYSNAACMIYDQHNKKVDLEVIFDEYYQSRQINQYSNYSKTRNYNVRRLDGSKSEKNKCKYSRHWGTRKKNRGLIKEYKDSFYANEYDISIRDKRKRDIKSYISDEYYDYYYYRSNSKNWKSNRKTQYRTT